MPAMEDNMALFDMTVPGPGQYTWPIAVICGSMRYYNTMLAYAAALTTAGWIVLMPFLTGVTDDTKRMLDEMHREKIRMAQRVFVVGGHVGESTASEINFAKELNRSIYYLPSVYVPDPESLI